MFVERNAGQPEKIILEVIQIPGDRLAIEAGARIADLVIQIAAGLHLKARQHSHDFAICLDRLGSNLIAGAILREKFEQRRVAEVLFEICALAQIFRINFRNRQPCRRKCRENSRKRDILFTHAVQNADRAGSPPVSRMILRPEPPSSPAAAHPLSRRVEMLLEKLSENVHEDVTKITLNLTTSSWTFSGNSSSVSTWPVVPLQLALVVAESGGDQNAIDMPISVHQIRLLLEFSRHFRLIVCRCRNIGEDLAQGAYLEEDFGDTTLF